MQPFIARDKVTFFTVGKDITTTVPLKIIDLVNGKYLYNGKFTEKASDSTMIGGIGNKSVAMKALNKINEQIKPYMRLLKDLLHEKYHIAEEELEQWQEIYRKRLQNDKIPRKLTTVARNLWEKLTVEERFVKPLVQLLEMKKDISEGAQFIKKLIECGTQDEEPSKIREKLMEIWNVCPEEKFYST